MRIHIDIQGPEDAAAAIVETSTTVLGSCSAAINGRRLMAACSHAEPLNTRISTRALSIAEALTLADHLCTQTDALARRGWSVISLNMCDIVDIDGRYILCSTDALARTVGGRVTVSDHSKTCDFAAPEVKSASDGQTVDARCACFAIGKLVAHALFIAGTGTDLDEEGADIPASVPIGSKLYWFFDRCLKLDARDRMLLLM
jgi:hypothetical protein